MPWNRRYSLASYLRSALWVAPVLAVVVSMAVKRLSEVLAAWLVAGGVYDRRTGFWGIDETEAHSLLERIFTLNLSCLVFAFGSMLVAIQVASGQYTPRVIATTLLRDRVIRLIVGLFAFGMLWANRTLIELGQMREVPQLQVFLASIFGLASLVAFIVLIDYGARSLRPVSLVQRVGQQGMAVIKQVYPALLGQARTHRPQPTADADGLPDVPTRVIYHKGKSAIVLALHLDGLAGAAQRAGCVFEFAPQVGDFVGMDEPLFYVYGNAGAIIDDRVRGMVAFGAERTMEQDPMFAFRIEVDIALKALSAAINDPTTAVLVIDQLQRMLGMVGKRALHDNKIRDGSGQPRLILRTPNWEDYVHMCFREIRQCGAGSLQIERRLRAMVQQLLATLPAQRHPALHVERELLDLEVQREHMFKQDSALARIPDSQGLGGAAGAPGMRGHAPAAQTRH
ncbi:DUF2254 domain-containing protein [Massilia horti]|uniref:DUF2254 domain-containing protein n=2 Tax=Massilia horti TaxID=2562153 RepID=A0A4Y9T5A3_9BURK|nr:DUF2254 domain-containing protein [Massilia horti]